MRRFFSDEGGRIFYEVTLSARRKTGAMLAAGNFRHFPAKPFVVSAGEMIESVN